MLSIISSPSQMLNPVQSDVVSLLNLLNLNTDHWRKILPNSAEDTMQKKEENIWIDDQQLVSPNGDKRECMSWCKENTWTDQAHETWLTNCFSQWR